MRDDIEDNVNRFFMPPRILKKRPSKAKMKRIRRRKRIRRFIALSCIVIAVIALGVTFTNAGCDLVLGLAKNYVSENMNLNLKAETVTGNSLKGYTMKNAEFEDEQGRKILTVESLSGYLSFSSLLKGRITLSEIFMQGVSIDLAGTVNVLQNTNLHYEAQHDGTIHLFSSPAIAEESEHANIIHLDRLRIRDGRINSRIAVMNLSKIDVDFRKSIAEIDADINGLPLRGNIDMGNDSEFTLINRADMNLGSGKITAVGGLLDDNIFDVHVTAEDLNLKDVTAIFPDVLSSMDFDGNLNLNLDVTGTKESPRIFGSVDYIGKKIYGFLIERMSANYNCSVNDNMLMINNIQASVMSVPIQGEIYAQASHDENIELRIKLDGSETNLEKLDELLNIPELKSLGGRIDAFNVNLNGSINSLSGLVNLTAPKITFNGRTFSNIRLQVKLSGSNTGNVDGKFKFEGTNGFVHGNVESILTGSNMNLTAKIADMDIKRVENIIPDYPTYNLNGKITLSLKIEGRTSRPSITGSLSSNEFNVKSQIIIKPVIEFKIQDEALTIERTEGTVNGMPLKVTGTIKPFPSSNPELDITLSGMRITGELNNPTISFIASEDAKLSPDIKEATQEKSNDAELKAESGIESGIESEDIKTETESNDIIESRDIKTESADIKDIKEEESKDENTAD